MNEVKQEPTLKELLERFATVANISIEEAEQLVGATTNEGVLENIKKYNEQKIREQMPKLNRAQRRALAKKTGNKALAAAPVITETAEKLNYIDLIQKLRDLNAKKEQENEEDENAN